MQLSDYLAAIPNLHSWDNGATWNTGGFEAFHFEALHRLIAELLRPGPAFIETYIKSEMALFERLPDPFRIDRPTGAELADARVPSHPAQTLGKIQSRIFRAVRRLLP